MFISNLTNFIGQHDPSWRKRLLLIKLTYLLGCLSLVSLVWAPLTNLPLIVCLSLVLVSLELVGQVQLKPQQIYWQFAGYLMLCVACLTIFSLNKGLLLFASLAWLLLAFLIDAKRGSASLPLMLVAWLSGLWLTAVAPILDYYALANCEFRIMIYAVLCQLFNRMGPNYFARLWRATLAAALNELVSMLTEGSSDRHDVCNQHLQTAASYRKLTDSALQIKLSAVEKALTEYHYFLISQIEDQQVPFSELHAWRDELLQVQRRLTTNQPLISQPQIATSAGYDYYHKLVLAWNQLC